MRKINDKKAGISKFISGLAIILAFVIAAQAERGKSPQVSENTKVSQLRKAIEPNLTGSYLAAIIAERRGKFEKATEFYTKAAGFMPDNPGIRSELIATLARTGKVESAVKLAESTFGSSTVGVTIMKAVLLAKQGEYTKAREALNSFPAETIGGILLPAMNAWLLAGEGRYDNAIKTLSSSLSDESSIPVVLYHMALINNLAGNHEMADVNFSASLDAGQYKAQRVVEVYGDFLKKSGRKNAALKVYERFAEASGNNWFAHEAIKAAASNEPIAGVATPEEGLAELLFNLASMVYDTEESSDAYIYINLSLHLRPDFANAQLMKGLFLESDGRFSDAINVYSAINARSIFSLRAKYQTASCLAGLSKTDEAIAGLRQLSGQRPDLADINTQIGDILRSEEKYAEAAKEYSTAITKTNGSQHGSWVLYYSRAVSLERSELWQQAEADFKKALELNPNQPDVLNYLSYSWLERGVNFKLALANLEKAVKLRPNQAHILDSYGWALFKNGRVNESIEQLEYALELKPDDPFINDHLGDAFWQAGREREARFQWSRALRYNPDVELAADIDSKLKNGLISSSQTAAIATSSESGQ